MTKSHFGHRRKRPLRPAVSLHIPVDPELKELIGKAADKEGKTMNEWIAELAAKKLGRPDLADIPRKPMGRPRKEPEPQPA